MSGYTEFESSNLKYSRPGSKGMSQRTKSVLTVIVSVVIATSIIGLLFSILMNQIINTTHHELNQSLNGKSGKLGSTINNFLKNATEWINKAAAKANLSTVEIVPKSEDDLKVINSTGPPALPAIFGNNGNFFGKFFNAIGKAISKVTNESVSSSTPRIDPAGTNVYRLDVEKNE